MTPEERQRKREAEMRRGAEIVAKVTAERAPKVARFFLAQQFDPDFVPPDKPQDDLPGDFVSEYNRALWERNKNREDFK